MPSRQKSGSEAFIGRKGSSKPSSVDLRGKFQLSAAQASMPRNARNHKKKVPALGATIEPSSDIDSIARKTSSEIIVAALAQGGWMVPSWNLQA